jgi:hypothetical protein
MRRVTWPIGLATVLAFASAAVSLYWTLGGTALLDTVGGAIEDLARDGGPGATAVALAAVLAKLLAGLLGLGLIHPPATRVRRRLVTWLSGVAGVVLVLWGGANVLVGGLVLAEVITPGEVADRRALRWHVFLWDLWFLVWGAALVYALLELRRRRAGAAAA